MDNSEWEKVKKVLIKYAHQVDACSSSIAEIKRLANSRDLEMFLNDYSDFIPEINNGKERVDTTESIIEWFNSPFISNYDKERVLTTMKRDRI